IICSGIGVVVFLVVPATLAWPVRLILGWDVGVLLFLLGTLLAIRDASPDRMRRRSRYQDERRSVVLSLGVAASALSLFAIAFLLAKSGPMADFPTPLRAAVAGGTVVLSWMLVHTIFALHYTHAYYGDGGDRDLGGLDFPGDQSPDYWDFVYF